MEVTSMQSQILFSYILGTCTELPFRDRQPISLCKAVKGDQSSAKMGIKMLIGLKLNYSDGYHYWLL